MGQDAGTGWLDKINFWVTDKPAPAAPETRGFSPIAAGVAGGYFAMTTEQMRAEIAELREIWDLIQKREERSRPLRGIDSPGYDPASVQNTEVSNTSGQYYSGHTGRQGQYLRSFIEKMERALGETEEQEQQASEDVTNQGGGPF